MKVRNPVYPVTVEKWSPEYIVGKGLLWLCAAVGFFDMVSAGWLWK